MKLAFLPAGVSTVEPFTFIGGGETVQLLIGEVAGIVDVANELQQ